MGDGDEITLRPVSIVHCTLVISISEGMIEIFYQHRHADDVRTLSQI
jgi:hypothetical protein